MGALLAHVGPGDEVILPSCSFSFTAQAIVSVHHADMACEMDTLVDIARRHGLMAIEDAAQSYGSICRGGPPGAIGELGCLSLREAENVISGEGGALLVDDGSWVERAEVIREKVTAAAPSSEVRWTSTAGSMSARPACPAS
ncbi:MAG: DegT/DnrJ/EryC1/StrS family aminotransferase [Burkholderiaceae bacterium]|jgi:dTDP-4-amino-4,6-dideoxygalactose transaminase|nr:DegT/DnrJ/EryC1/StrS family aminotransferase [Burkholderiaceae bacterium]MCU0965718.1 DegT/DnrJ/EryC1/StrS family aminotransferase [Burkholderiaceae bacterium]